MRLTERVFVVTGASSGIGQATARALTDAGASVALVARRADRLTALDAELGPTAIAIPVDITTGDAPDVIHDRTVAAFGRIDGLINAAGRGLVAPITRLDLDDLDEAFELNLVAPIRLIQRIVPTLVAQREGAIVNVTSATAELGLPVIGGYALTKAALGAVTATLRRELFGTGVQVIAAYPGVTESEFYQQVMGENDGSPPPPAQPAHVVARAIVRAIARNQREVWTLSGSERRRLRTMRLIGRLSPIALDRALAGGQRDSSGTDQGRA